MITAIKPNEPVKKQLVWPAQLELNIWTLLWPSGISCLVIGNHVYMYSQLLSAVANLVGGALSLSNRGPIHFVNGVFPFR